MDDLNKFLKTWLSRKVLLAIVTALGLFFQDAFGVDIEAQTIWGIVAAVGAYIGAEGARDIMAAKNGK